MFGEEERRLGGDCLIIWACKLNIRDSGNVLIVMYSSPDQLQIKSQIIRIAEIVMEMMECVLDRNITPPYRMLKLLTMC